MTGYGRGVAHGRGLRATCELTSVNRKQLDVRVSLPKALGVLESRVLERVRASVSRGHVSGSVELALTDRARAGSVGVDVALAAGYARALREAARQLRIDASLTVRDLLALPDVLVRTSPAADAEAAWRVIDKALRTALREIVRMRAREGRRLAADLGARLRALEALHTRIAGLAAKVPARYRAQLERRLRELAGGPAADPGLVARELAVAAERCDVSEELTRLRSHLIEARRLCRVADSSGRNLDFLLQEISREINTLGAKAADVEVSRLVVEFKSELERVREQVQNVE